MKPLLFVAFLSLSLAACQKDKEDPQPDYLPSETKDWYILRAPDNSTVAAVAGDIDGMLTITTRNKVYLTTDRGKTWVTGNYDRPSFLAGLLQKQDTLLAMTLRMRYNSGLHYATGASHFSLDRGLTWRPYIDRSYYPNQLRSPLDHLTTAAGTQYSIEYLLTPMAPNSTSMYVETIGVETSTGQHITLPQQHQLTSIYFDAKSRLYITGSASVCGRGKEFKFCSDQKGTLYISKQPQL